MLNHVSIGAASLAASKKFYDAVLGELGYRCLVQDNASLGYGVSQVSFWVLKSEKPVADEPTSGLHFCFDAPDSGSVNRFHAAGVRAGGRDNGKPGLRADYSPDYYAAFLVDCDGYRIEAYCRSAK
jgi:catechol 2,3-dioxygenase-like lactoylglutathione lyase family enzyme